MPDIDDGQHVSIRTSRFNPTPDSPWQLVEDRFNRSLESADQLLDILIGESGNAGMLGDFKDVLDLVAERFEITADDVDTAFNVSNIDDAPDFNDSLLDEFPESLSLSDPELKDIPGIDMAELTLPDEPDDINPQIVWEELILNQDIYQKFLTRLTTDLTEGATGLDPEVQEDIFDSGRLRQQRIRDRAYKRLNDDISARGALVPAGTVLGALADLEAQHTAEDSELNRTITIEQANLAQNNSQFAITEAGKLETLLRDTRHKDSDRALDYAKSVATLTLQVYSEKVRMYITIVEAKKMYVEAQVANIQGIVAYNTALLDEYKSVIEAYGIRVNAVSLKNKSLVDIYKGRVDGYAAEARAVATLDGVRIEKVKADIQNADLKLRAAIAEATANIDSWSTEHSLKEKLLEALSSIASNAFVGALSSVHANASMGYQGTESRQESYSQSKSLNESHNYQEDPAVE